MLDVQNRNFLALVSALPEIETKADWSDVYDKRFDLAWDNELTARQFNALGAMLSEIRKAKGF